MSAATLPAPGRLSVPRTASRIARAVRTEAGLARLAMAIVGLHVADDTFLQPPPGTSAGDHLVSGLVPLGLLALAAWAYPRLEGFPRGTLALLLALMGAAMGMEAVYYTGAAGPSGDDYTGLLAIPAALLLAGVGAATLWRTRRVTGNRPWRYARRLLLAAGAFAVFSVAVVPVVVGYGSTHMGRAVVPPDELGVPHEDVTFTTGDGLELHGWYVPSRNGAAVIAFPGRKGPQAQTRMLARHGYGVLLFDRRGEGVSDGAPNSWGWGGERDVKAAIAYLQDRPDVDPGRIGGIGLSVGGEMMIDAASDTPALRAVVSEGAGARSIKEARHLDLGGTDKVLFPVAAAIRTAAVAVLANQPPPADLEKLAARVEQPLLLIAAPESPNGEELNRRYVKAAGSTATLWEIPEARHMGGLDARPEEYERRVVGFFDEALAP